MHRNTNTQSHTRTHKHLYRNAHTHIYNETYTHTHRRIDMYKYRRQTHTDNPKCIHKHRHRQTYLHTCLYSQTHLHTIRLAGWPSSLICIALTCMLCVLHFIFFTWSKKMYRSCLKYGAVLMQTQDLLSFLSRQP